jgi:hypothetical protein
MDVVNAVCTMLSFGGIAGLAIILGRQQKKKLRQRDEEIMSTISAIQYSQLKGNKHGSDNRDDGTRSGVLICADDSDSSERDHNRSHKCS